MFGLGIITIIIGGIFGIMFICQMLDSRKNEADFGKIGIIVLAGICAICVFAGLFITNLGMNAESFKRWQKDLESEYDGGLQRTITVIDKDGEILKEYSGSIDIQSTDGNKLVFVMEGKKYIIYNNNIFNTIFVEEE